MEFPEFFEEAARHTRRPETNQSSSLGSNGHEVCPAPWYIDPPTPLDGNAVTDIDLRHDANLGSSPIDIEEHDWGDSGFSTGGTDAVGFYIPWHVDPQRWGVYFVERPFFAFVRDLAAIAGERPGRLAPIVLRQVLWHELTHFRFEVAASTLEDVLGRPLYLDYLSHRYGRPAVGLKRAGRGSSRHVEGGPVRGGGRGGGCS